MNKTHWHKVVTLLNPAHVDEAAKEFGVSRSTLQRLMREGKLSRYVRTGDRKAYVDRDELRELLTLRKEPPKPPQPRRHRK